MFVVWEDGGIKSPYAPGLLRGRKVEKVESSPPIHRVGSQSEDHNSQGSISSRPSVVQAYQSSTSERSMRKPAILAKQIMTSPVVTLAPTADLSEAWAMVKHKRFRHIPIISMKGKLVGLLSDRDLLRKTIDFMNSSETSLSQTPHIPIQEIMVTNVLSASPETEIRAIARILFEERIGSMPIVDENETLVGVLTRSDILRTVVNEAPLELWI